MYSSAASFTCAVMVRVTMGNFLMKSRIPNVTKLDPFSKNVVGVIDFKTPNNKIPCRIYYPAAITRNIGKSVAGADSRANVGWFVHSFAHFIEGYMHFLLPNWKHSSILVQFISGIAWLLSWIIPHANAHLPQCERNAKPASSSSTSFGFDKGYPLILYSHGLTGSGEEHGLMFTHWAQRGYVVASLQHCDGSSCRVLREDGAHIYYDWPDMKQYDPTFRPNQVERREAELQELRAYILGNNAEDSGSDVTTESKGSDTSLLLTELRDHIDPSNIVVAGFSYGAATAALSVAKHPTDYKACMLLDGWFFIELTGHMFEFPAEAHEIGLSVPALFLGSEQFANYTKLAEATSRLAAHNSHPKGSVLYVLENSRHQNFTDIGFWLPVTLLKWSSALGKCDYDQTYQRILDLTTQFLDTHCHNSPPE